MTSRACLLVDGSNFYHALKTNGYLGLFNYSNFYQTLNRQHNITSVFFYDATKNRIFEPAQYAGQQAFHAKLQKDIPGLTIRSRKLKYILSNVKLDKAKKKASFCSSCKPKIDPFLSDAGLLKLSKEKGIDILLVTDMIKGAFQNNFDTVLLATGDADFVPAVELVQTLKKKVINVHFYTGSASELRNACNSHLLVQVDATGNCYFG